MLERNGKFTPVTNLSLVICDFSTKESQKAEGKEIPRNKGDVDNNKENEAGSNIDKSWSGCVFKGSRE